MQYGRPDWHIKAASFALATRNHLAVLASLALGDAPVPGGAEAEKEEGGPHEDAGAGQAEEGQGHGGAWGVRVEGQC